MSEKKVRLDREGRVAVLTIDRAEARNAIDLDVVGELHALLDLCAREPEPPIAIVTGAGDKAFAAGADIRELRDRRASDAFARINTALFARVESYPMPTIAAVNGWCLGGGCELAIACDLRVASETAKFGQPEAGLGIMAAAGATRRLPRLVGLGISREILFTGRILSAGEALSMGLVNRVVPAERLLEEAKSLAREIATRSTLALRLTKINLNHAHELSELAAQALESTSQAVLFESEDKFRRMTEFLERKKTSP